MEFLIVALVGSIWWIFCQTWGAGVVWRSAWDDATLSIHRVERAQVWPLSVQGQVITSEFAPDLVTVGH